MKKLIFLGVIAAGLMSAGMAYALEFSADMASTTEGMSVTGKMFVSNDKIRMEMTGAITITRIDKKIAWVIMPDQKMYMEQPIDVNTVAGATEEVPGEVERTLLGSDTIDGRSCEKYRIVYVLHDKKRTMLQWIDKASSIPLKSSSEDESWSMEYKNLSVGPQAESLFEIPEGYQKFTMPSTSDMMNTMQGMPQNADQ